MKSEHKELIHDYLRLDKNIRRAYKRLEWLEWEFYSQNFCGRTEFNILGVKTVGFRVDSKVGSYVDVLNACEHNIKKMKRKKYHFERYLKTLDNNVYISLKRRYGSYKDLEQAQELGHDKKVVDELLEIEDAVKFEFKELEFDKEQHEKEEIEDIELNADTLELSFNKITEMLGV